METEEYRWLLWAAGKAPEEPAGEVVCDEEETLCNVEAHSDREGRRVDGLRDGADEEAHWAAPPLEPATAPPPEVVVATVTDFDALAVFAEAVLIVTEETLARLVLAEWHERVLLGDDLYDAIWYMLCVDLGGRGELASGLHKAYKN